MSKRKARNISYTEGINIVENRKNQFIQENVTDPDELEKSLRKALGLEFTDAIDEVIEDYVKTHTTKLTKEDKKIMKRIKQEPICCQACQEIYPDAIALEEHQKRVHGMKLHHPCGTSKDIDSNLEKIKESVVTINEIEFMKEEKGVVKSPTCTCTCTCTSPSGTPHSKDCEMYKYATGKSGEEVLLEQRTILEAKIVDLEQKLKNEQSDKQMYIQAWVRSLGEKQKLFPKIHLIDSLVKTTEVYISQLNTYRHYQTGLVNIIAWSSKMPTDEGTYLFQSINCSIKLCYVHKGKWQYAENPEWLYVTYHNGSEMKQALSEITPEEKVMWFGPIPNYPVHDNTDKEVPANLIVPGQR